jgi:hypothetical protein
LQRNTMDLILNDKDSITIGIVVAGG